MKKYIYLSHFINETTPLYGGVSNIKIFQDKSISNGDTANTNFLQFPNHCGTHIDFPNHFSDSGKTINDYPAEFWFFYKPFIIKYIAEENEIINLGSFIDSIPNETDFLIINTGFQKYRSEEKYWKNNPGIHPDSAYLLKQKGVKVIGFDFISLSSYQNRELGRIAHKQFLIENDILIIEDMNLEGISSKLNKIISVPLLIDKINGVPITVIGETDE
jgi:arylformamidase